MSPWKGGVEPPELLLLLALSSPSPCSPISDQSPTPQGLQAIPSHLNVDSSHFLNLHRGFCFAHQPWGGEEGVFGAVFVPIRCQQSSWSCAAPADLTTGILAAWCLCFPPLLQQDNRFLSLL